MAFPSAAYGFQLVEVGKPLERSELRGGDLGPDEVMVEVADQLGDLAESLGVELRTDLDEEVGTAALDREIGAAVRSSPEQYQWNYKRFRTLL